MKKTVSLILAVAILLSCLPLCAAARTEVDEEAYPVILLPGLLENTLIKNKGQADESRAWFPIANAIKAAVKYAVPVVYQVYFGTEESITYWTNKILFEVVGDIGLNPDGTSEHDISPVVTEAEECSYTALKKSGRLAKVTYGTGMLKEVAERIGGDKAFVFQYDWRMSPRIVAAQLREFIADVKRLTGADKVNASGTSFGSEVLLTYLKYYGDDCDLNRVLMNSPAYGGSEIFKAFFTDYDHSIKLNYENVFNMILSNFHLEAEIGHLLKIVPQKTIDLIFHAGVFGWMREELIPSVAVWGCCGVGDYEEMKELLLDPVANAEVIKENDIVHHEIMEKTGEIIRDAQAKGVQVFAIANEGAELITSSSSGDVLVDASNSTGGVCLPVGEHFPDDYVPERRVCTDESHDHVSYTGSIDLTNCYTPETTWVFYGEMHGQNYWDTRARALTLELMTDDKINDVWSSPDYPQFAENAMLASDVSLTLKDSPELVFDPAGGEVTAVVTNHSQIHTMLVKNITSDGLPYKISRTTMLLAPGKSVQITLTPDGSAAEKYASITLEYSEIPNLKINKTRTEYVKVIK